MVLSTGGFGLNSEEQKQWKQKDENRETENSILRLERIFQCNNLGIFFLTFITNKSGILVLGCIIGASSLQLPLLLADFLFLVSTSI